MSSLLDQKAAGLLVPVFALRRPGDLGIGDTETVCDAIDFCAAHSLKVLQLLPINETGGDHSPYNAISSVALDPIYLTINPDAIPGLTTEDVAAAVKGKNLASATVDYGVIKPLKQQLLHTAFMEFEKKELGPNTPVAQDFLTFQQKESRWLGPYTLFRMLLAEHRGDARWPLWYPAQQNPDAAERWLRESPNRERLEDDRLFYAYIQWIAYTQWQEVKEYADDQGVALMGDIPFGISRFSADVWAHQNLFDLTWSGGAPPEKFFQTDEFTTRWGQNWGIPLYRWPVHEESDYRWWRQRVEKTVEIFHSFRIDHVLGFFRVYSFPWTPEHNAKYTHIPDNQAAALTGGRLPQFVPRPDQPISLGELNGRDGRKRLKVILEAAGDAVVVAEDLGVVPDYVRPILAELKIPGFTIPIFERIEATREYKVLTTLPALNLATYATHDHAPLRSFYEDLVKRWHGANGHESWLEIQRLMRFLGWNDQGPPATFVDELHQALIRRLLESPCWLSVFMITDLLGTAQRFNEPGSATQSNWSQRLTHSLEGYAHTQPYQQKIQKMSALIQQTGRAKA